MRKCHLITLFALLLSLMINAGCGKKNQPAPAEIPQLPKAVFKGDGEPYYTLAYNNNNQLTSFSFKASLQQPNETYTYTGSKLTAINTATQTTVLTYNGAGQVIKTETRTISTNHLEFMRQYNYNTAGKVSTIDRYQNTSTSSESLTIALTYTYRYNSDGLITTVTDHNYSSNSDVGIWQITGYSAPMSFQPLVIDKIIFGDDFDFVVLSTMNRLPLSVYYQKPTSTLPFFFTDTYQYATTDNRIININYSTVVTQNGSETVYNGPPFAFSY